MDSLYMSENNLFIIKEKIIKTDEVLKLLGEKNKELNKLQRKYKKLLEKLSRTQPQSLSSIDDCSNKHIAWENEIKSLKFQNDLLEQKHNEYVNTSEIKFQTACQEIADLTKSNEKFTKKIEKLEGKEISMKNVTKLQETLNLTKEELKTHKLKHEELINNNNKTIAELKLRCKGLEEQRNCDLKQLVKARLDCDELKKTIEIKKSSPDVTKLQETLNSTKEELKTHKLKLEELISNNNKTIAELKLRCKGLEEQRNCDLKQLVKARLDSDELKKTIEIQKSSISPDKLKLQELEHKLESSEKELNILKIAHENDIDNLTKNHGREVKILLEQLEKLKNDINIQSKIEIVLKSSTTQTEYEDTYNLEEIFNEMVSIPELLSPLSPSSIVKLDVDNEDISEQLISAAIDTEDVSDKFISVAVGTEDFPEYYQHTFENYSHCCQTKCNKFKFYPRCQLTCNSHNNLVYNNDSEEDSNLNPILKDYKRLVIENYFTNKYLRKLTEKNNFIHNYKEHLVNKKIFVNNKINKKPIKLKNKIINKTIFNQSKYKRIIYSSESEEESSHKNITNDSDINVNIINEENVILNSANRLAVPVISPISFPLKENCTKLKKIKLTRIGNIAKRQKISRVRNRSSKLNYKKSTIYKSVKRKCDEEINKEYKKQKLNLFGSDIDSDFSSTEESKKSGSATVILNNNCDNLVNDTISNHIIESENVSENIISEKFVNCTNSLQQTNLNKELNSSDLSMDSDINSEKSGLLPNLNIKISNNNCDTSSYNISNDLDLSIEEEVQNEKQYDSCQQNLKTISPKMAIVETTEILLKNKRDDISNIVYKKPVNTKITLPLPVQVTEENSNKNNSEESEILSKTDKIFKRPEQIKIICKDSETDKNMKLSEQISCKKPVDSVNSQNRPNIDLDLAQKLISDVITLKWDKNLMLTVVSYLTKYDSECVAKLIVDQAAKDFSQELDKTFTPPAPLLTESQQKVLVLLNHLEKRDLSNINDRFLDVLERKLLSETKVEVVHPLTRLYVAVCKLKYDIEKVRILCCNAAFYMGELLLPVMFIVLTMWGDILPMADNSDDIPLAVALTQVIQLKTCKQPGYNFTNLNRLLSDYYGYTRGAKSNDEIMNQLTSSYSENCSKTAFTAILILCRNLPNKWTYNQIKSKLLPLVEKFKNDNKPECTLLTINLIQRLIETFQAAEDLQYFTDIKNCISE